MDEDVESRGMGQNGVDIILSPAAKRAFGEHTPISFPETEIKCVESLNVVTTFWQHFAKYSASLGTKLLIHRKNRYKALVTMRFEDFLNILRGTNN